MKKRIFIASHYMEIGGAEISLIGLLQSIDYSKYDVDLFVYSHRGELMSLLPQKVNLLPENKFYAATEKPIKEVLLSSSWIIGLARLFCKCKYKKYKIENNSKDSFVYFQLFENIVYKVLPTLYKYGEYDIALNFIADTTIVLDKVKAKKTVTWIHSDYSSFCVNPKLSLPTFNKVDYIASISKAATNAFLQIYPTLTSKMIEIENILSPAFVRSRAEQGSVTEMEKKENDICLLSIGRFCYAKNYDNIPEIASRIIHNLSTINSQLKLKWYIIGFGSDETLIRKKIEESNMEKHVIILGKKDNPYPYIKKCDWYVQPSRYEGKSVTVREAQMLCKPVIITNYTTATSQVIDGVDGVIVPLENKSCAEAITKVIVNKELQKEIIEYLAEHDYGNVAEVQKIYDLI